MAVDVWVMRLDRAATRAQCAALVAAHPGRAASFSDSDGVAVLAIAAEGAVGADVERVRDRSRLDAVARRVLSSAQARAVETAQGEERLSVFYRGWTAAEASAKARGQGLPAMLGGRPLPALPVTWFEPAPGFVAAIAAPGGAPRLRLRDLR
jgi:4'-phosphopantetheinyl transferase